MLNHIKNLFLALPLILGVQTFCMDFISTMPQEMLVEVTNSLSLKDAAQLLRVCKATSTMTAEQLMGHSGKHPNKYSEKEYRNILIQAANSPLKAMMQNTLNNE